MLIGGVIIGGDVPKKVALRAVGPSLARFGVPGVLRDPKLTLHDARGAMIALNDNWRSNAAAVQATGLAPSDDLEAVIVTTLAPGTYTAILSGAGGTTGVGLFELYDLEPTRARVANISTRGRVEGGDGVLIGGFIIGGTEATQIIIRAIGPSMRAVGVAGALLDPALELYNGNGSRIFGNDNWRSAQEQQILTSGLAPTDDRECAITATLLPGNYTAIVRGTGGSTGVGLVEVYNLSR